MRETVLGILALAGFAAVAATLALWAYVFIHAYAEIDRRDANSWWQVLSTR